MKKFFVVTQGALRALAISELRRKSHGRILPDRRVKATSVVKVPGALGVNLAETLNTLFEWDKSRVSPVKAFH